MSHNCTRDTAPTWGMLALASTHGSHFVAPELSSGGFSGDSDGKESTCQCRRFKRLRFNPWVGKIPWRKKQKPTPVFLPGKFRGQRSLAGYSPRGRKESDMTERLHSLQLIGQFVSTLGVLGIFCWLLKYKRNRTLLLLSGA